MAETAEEKRARMARAYLEEIEKEGERRASSKKEMCFYYFFCLI